MQALISSFALAMLYGISAISPNKWPYKIISYLALLLHSYLLYLLIDTNAGHDLSMVNMLAFTIWCLGLLYELFNYKINNYKLQPYIFTLCALAMFIPQIKNSTNIYKDISSFMLIHILFALVGLSIILFALLQALDTLNTKYKLKHNLLTSGPSLEEKLKATMLLTVSGFSVISLSFIIVMLNMSTHISNKVVLSLSGWLILGYTLYFMYKSSWQIATINKILCISLVLLTLGYMSSVIL